MNKVMSNLLTFLERWIQLRTTNHCIKAGQILCLLGFGGSGLVVVTSAIHGVPITFEWSSGNNAILGFLCGLIGVFLLVIGALIPPHSVRSTVVTLMGIPGVSANVPDKAIGKPYSLYNPAHYNFSIDRLNPASMVEKLNGYCRHVIDDQIINDSRNGKVFFAGLARIPCLFAMGTYFRSSAMDVEPLERFRNPDHWSRLNLFKSTGIKYSIDGDPKKLVTENKELGVLVSMTDEILPEQIPILIRDHCLVIRLTDGARREAISTIPDLHDFASTFKGQLDRCSKVADTIHLFVCAQSSVVFEMGRAYQEGMHGRILIYNYLPSEGYNWGIEIHDGNMSYVKSINAVNS